MSHLLLPDLSARASLDREVRAFTVAPVELRDGADEAPRFTGYASVVEQPYEVHDMFGEFEETMARGAFTRSLKAKDDVRLLVNHQGVPLARTKSGTLTLRETPDLYVEATLDSDNPTVQEVRSAMRRGDLDQMSIGMRVLRQEWNDDYSERRILEARLFDVSVVTIPASPTTTAALRSLDEFIATLSDVDPDEVRRAITHLETLLGTPEPEARTFVHDFYEQAVADLWNKRLGA